MTPRTDKTYLYDSRPRLASSLFGAAMGAFIGLFAWGVGSFHWAIALAMGLGVGVLMGVGWHLEMKGTGEPSQGNPRWLDRLTSLVIVAYMLTLIVEAHVYRVAVLVAAAAGCAITIAYNIYDFRRRHFGPARSPGAPESLE